MGRARKPSSGEPLPLEKSPLWRTSDLENSSLWGTPPSEEHPILEDHPHSTEPLHSGDLPLSGEPHILVEFPYYKEPPSGELPLQSGGRNCYQLRVK